MSRAAVPFVGGLGALTFLVHVFHLLTHDSPWVTTCLVVAVSVVVSARLIDFRAGPSAKGFGSLAPRLAMWTLTWRLVLVALTPTELVFRRAAGGTDVAYAPDADTPAERSR